MPMLKVDDIPMFVSRNNHLIKTAKGYDYSKMVPKDLRYCPDDNSVFSNWFVFDVAACLLEHLHQSDYHWIFCCGAPLEPQERYRSL